MVYIVLILSYYCFIAIMLHMLKMENEVLEMQSYSLYNNP